MKMKKLPRKVTVIEVSPRDGIEGLKREIPLDLKVKLIDDLLAAGVKAIEYGGFVSPKAVPPLKDTALVYQRINKLRGVRYMALVPNMHGFEDALAAGAKEITVFIGATETFNKANIRRSIEESLDDFGTIISAARSVDIQVRGGIAMVLGCPYEGHVDPSRVAEIAKHLWDLGCHEIGLGDSLGYGTPLKVQGLLQECMDEGIPVEKLSLHFHNTYGQALANIYAGLEMGAVLVESAAGGLGGCPYAPGATGNVASEDLVYMLNGLEIETDIDLDKLAEVARFICKSLDKPMESNVNLAMQARQAG